MADRIGMLHLHYRVGLSAGESAGESALAPALTAGLDRAIQAGLGAALAPRLAALAGDERAVVVVRELHAPLRLAVDDCTLDSHVVDLFSRACVDAMATLLSANPSTDTVMRFADETAFAGAFVAALLDGSAWRLWYFGAFHRYRRDGVGATVAALVREAGVAPLPLFGWLARQGHLPRLLVHLPPAQARGLLGHAAAPGMPAGPGSGDGNAVLVDAARRLLAALDGIAEGPAPAVLDERIAAFLAERPVGPDWRSRASLSAWVAQLLRFVLRLAPGDAREFPAPGVDALRGLLAGPLDWLDGAAILDALCTRPGHAGRPAIAAGTAGAPRHLLSPRQERILVQLARRLRDRTLVLPDGAGADTLFVTLMAAAAADMDDDAAGAGIATIVDLALRAWHGRAAHDHAAVAGGSDPVAALRAAGPAALDLLAALRALDNAGAAPDDMGPMAGVLLLARAVNDLRLHALARHAGVPVAPMMAALARLWAGVPVPASPVTALWCGEDDGDDIALDRHGPALAGLREALATLLADRRMIEDAGAALVDRDAAALAPLLPGCAVAADVAAIGALLLRGWGHWLPGMAASGPLFLLERTVRRGGCVVLDERRLAVELDPAPFDVVLRMAGYLAPLGPVAWLGGRTVDFTVRGQARAVPP